MTVRYFVIIGTMRSGSNFLEKQIAASDDVVTYGEAFNPAFTGGPKRPDLAGWTVSDRDADPLGFLAALRDDAAPATMGFRLFNGHSDRLLAHVVNDPECGVIVLRRDPAESFVSLNIAEATGQWLLKTARRRKHALIDFDPVRYDRYESVLDQFYSNLFARLERAGKAAFVVDYADVGKRPVIEDIARFLGVAVPDQDTELDIIRQNPGPLHEKVANPAEMLAHLRRRAEPDRNASVSPGTWTGSRSLPLRWCQLPFQDDMPGLAVLEVIESRNGQRPVRSPSQLSRIKSEIFDVGAGAERLPGEIAFVLVEPAALRFHSLFLAHGFRGPSALHFVVKQLDDECGPAGPSKNQIAAIESDAGLAEHRRRFLAFLDIISEARARRGIHPVHEGWQPQSAYVAAAHDDERVTVIMHQADFSEGLGDLTGLLSLPSISKRDAAWLVAQGEGRRKRVERVLTDGLRERISALE